MTKRTLTVFPSDDDSATLKIGEHKVLLSKEAFGSYIATQDLPDLAALAKAALLHAPTFQIGTSVHALYVRTLDDHAVTEICAKVKTEGQMALYDVLPADLDFRRAQRLPAHAVSAAAKAASGEFEFCFYVGTNRMSVGCAASVPTLDGPIVDGNIAIGMTAPLKSSGHSIKIAWATALESVHFAHFLEQIGADARAILPDVQVSPRHITYLNGGDLRCHAVLSQSDQVSYDGNISADWRNNKLSRLRLSLCSEAPPHISKLLAWGSSSQSRNLPETIGRARIANVSALFDFEELEFALSGQALDVFGQNASMSVTTQMAEQPTIVAKAEFDGEATTTLTELITKVGFADNLGQSLRHLPLTTLPMRLRVLSVDSRWPALFCGLRLGDNTHWVDVDLAIGKTPDGVMVRAAYRAPAEVDSQMSVGNVLGSNLMPENLRSQLTTLVKLGDEEPGFVKVLMSAVLNEADFAITVKNGGQSSCQLSGVATFAGLPMRADMALSVGPNEASMRLSLGTVPGHFVTLAGLIKAFDIPLDISPDVLPLTRFALNDLTLDTKRKSFRIGAVASNGYDPEAANVDGYNCLCDLDIVARNKAFSLKARVDSAAHPIGLRAIAEDFQLKDLSEILKATGDVQLTSCAIHLESEKKTVELSCGVKIGFENLLRTAGVSELPHGVPTDLVMDGFTLRIEGNDKVTFKGSIEFKGARAKMFELAKGSELQLAKLAFSMTRDKKKVNGKLKLEGKPKADLSDDVRIESYSLDLAYKEDGTNRSWKLGGALQAHLFGTRALTLKANSAWEKNSRSLSLEGDVEALDQIEMSVARTAGALDVTSEVATLILSDLKNANHIDADGLIDKSFDPNKDGFDLGLRDDLRQHAEDVQTFILDKSALFAVAIAGQKLVDIEPHHLKLKLASKNAKRSIEMSIRSDLRLFVPGDSATPLVDLKKGTFAFSHKPDEQGKHETRINFSADDAKVKLPTLFEYNVASLDLSEDGKKFEPANDSMGFGVDLEFKKIAFKKTQKSWEIEGVGGLNFRNLPAQLGSLLEDTPTLSIKAGSDGVTLAGEGMFRPVVIPDFGAEINQAAGDHREFSLPELGEGRAALRTIDVTLGKHIKVGIGFAIALPAQLNEVLGTTTSDGKQLFRTWAQGEEAGMIDARLELGDEGFFGQVTGNPFNDIVGVTFQEVEGGASKAVIDFDAMFEHDDDDAPFGSLNVTLPKIGLNPKTGSLSANGGYSFDADQGLRIPLTPLRDLLRLFNLDSVAEFVPSGFPIKSRRLDAEGLRDLFNDFGVPFPNELDPLLHDWQHVEKMLPDRLRGYLEISVPSKLDFDIDVTPDAGVSFSISTGPRDETNPVQLLLPTMMGLQGIRLWKLSVGAAFGGTALKGDIDADIDLFDYPTLLGSIALLGDPDSDEEDLPLITKSLPKRHELQRTMVINDFSYLVIIATIIPIPVPLFYRELAVLSHGIEDVRIEMSASFPKPSFGFVEGIKFFSDLYRLFDDRNYYIPDVVRPLDLRPQSRQVASAPKEMNLTFSAGPISAQLPRYIKENGKTITLGVTESYELFDALNLTKLLLNGGKKLVTGDDTSYLLTSIPVKYRGNSVKLQFLEALNLQANWAVSTPAEFVSSEAAALIADADATSVAKQMLDALRSTPHPANTGEVIQVADDGIVVFLRGFMDIPSAMTFVAEGGTILSPEHGGMMALQIDGRIGSQDSPPANIAFRAYLKGAIAVTPKDTAIVMRGEADFSIMGTSILNGAFEFEQNPHGTKLRALQGLDVGFICVQTQLEGHINDTEFLLEGAGKVRIAMLSGEGKVHVLSTPRSTLIDVSAAVNLASVLKMGFRLRSEGHGPDTVVKLLFQAEVLSILKVAAQAQYVSGSNLTLKGGVRLLEQEVLSGTFSLTQDACTFSGQLELSRKGSGFYVSAEASGTLSAESVDLAASGNFQLGDFEGGAHFKVDVRTSGDGADGAITLKLSKLLAPDFDVELTARTDSTGQVTFEANAPKPLRILYDQLTVTGANAQTGPRALLSLKPVDNGGLDLEELFIDGSITFLGFKTQTALRYTNETQCMSATLTHNLPSLYGGTQLTVHGAYQPKKMTVEIEPFTMSLNIVKALEKVLASLGIQQDLGDLNVSLTLNQANVTIDRNPDRVREDKELAKRKAELEAELATLRDALERLQRETDELDKKLETALAIADDLRTSAKTDEDRDLWNSTWNDLHNSRRQVNYLIDARTTLTNEKSNLMRGELASAKAKFSADSKPYLTILGALEQLETARTDYALEQMRSTNPIFLPSLKAFYDARAASLKSKMLSYRSKAYAGLSAEKIEEFWREFQHHNYWLKPGKPKGDFHTKWYETHKRLILNPPKKLYDTALRTLKAAEAKEKDLDRQLSANQAEYKGRFSDAQNVLHRAQNNLGKPILDTAQEKLKTDREIYVADRAVALDIDAGWTKSSAKLSADTGYYVHVKTHITLDMDDGENVFDLLNVNWKIDDLALADTVIDLLPEMIIRFLGDNFIPVISGTFTTILDVISYLMSLVARAVGVSANKAGEVGNVSQTKLLAGYVGLSTHQAEILLSLNK